MPNDIAGTIYPPNSLARKGLIMTNPGHIDPGFKGLITVCLVNMGRDSIKLDSKTSVATLVLFLLDECSTGYLRGDGVGATKEQLTSIGKDFAGLNERIPKLVLKHVGIYSAVALAIIIAALGVWIAALAYFSPDINRYRIEKKDLESIENQLILPLQREINSLKEHLNASDETIEKLKVKIEELKMDLERDSSMIEDSINMPGNARMEPNKLPTENVL
jgi:dCTP deaminase